MENNNFTPMGVPVKNIITGFNYRRRYNPARIANLAEDIKRNGLIQPVTVRILSGGQEVVTGGTAAPTAVKVGEEGGYQLIAGGRRYMAFVQAYGEEAVIPTNARVLTDAEATALMMSENAEREDPSVIEDAEGAARMLGLCNGDRDEAASRLGWDRKKLDKRLALMNATQKVRDAYLEDHIGVGHVELLAAFRKEVQDRIIDKCIETKDWPTLEGFKAMASHALCSLEDAIFDRTECNGCQHNTGFQQAMFDTTFEGSRCSNKSCYDKKSADVIEVRRAKLEEDYQVVRIVRPGENHTVIALRADGDNGVGAEQAQACRTCGDFGAWVSTVPNKFGKTGSDACFNKQCHEGKVKANVAAKAEAERPAETAGDTSGQTDAPTGVATQAAAGATTTSPPKATKAEQGAAPAKLRTAITEYREQIWRKVFHLAAGKLEVIPSRQLLAAIVLTHPSWMDSHAAQAAVKKAVGVDLGSDLGRAVKNALALDQKQMAAIFNAAAAHVSTSVPIKDITTMLKALGVQIEDWWKVNETFFELLTKVELDAVCEEIGLAKAAGKTYPSLKNGPKKDFVAAMLKVQGFKYEGAVPKMMRW